MSTHPSSPTLPPLANTSFSTSTVVAPTSELSELHNLTSDFDRLHGSSDHPPQDPSEPSYSAVDSSTDESSDSEPEIPIPSDVDIDIASQTIRFWEQKRRGGKASGFAGFLRSLIQHRTTDGSKLNTRTVSELRRGLLHVDVVRRLRKAGIEVVDTRAKPDNVPRALLTTTIQAELKHLRECASFKTFETSKYGGTGPTTVEDICKSDALEANIRAAWNSIKKEAPALLLFFFGTMQNARYNQPSFKGRTKSVEEFRGPIVMIIAMIIYQSSPVSCNNLHHSIGMYLHSSGVPRRVLDTLARVGVSSRYTPVLRAMKGIAAEAKVRVDDL